MHLAEFEEVARRMQVKFVSTDARLVDLREDIEGQFDRPISSRRLRRAEFLGEQSELADFRKSVCFAGALEFMKLRFQQIDLGGLPEFGDQRELVGHVF